MEPELLAEGLGWAEGPAPLPDGRICFVESYRSQVSVWERGAGVKRYAYTAGGPNSCVLGEGGIGSLPVPRDAAGVDAPRAPSAPLDLERPFTELKAEVVTRFEEEYLVGQLARHGGNVSAAARASGLDRMNFKRLLRKYR